MTGRQLTGKRTLSVFAVVWVLGALVNSTAAYAQRGAMFVSNFVSENVSVYPRTVSGIGVPTRIIDATAGLNGPHEVTIYSSAAGKELVVANNEGNSITFYDANIASPTFGQLTRSIVGAQTGLNFPLGVTVDAGNGELFVSNDDHTAAHFSVTVYNLKALQPGVNNVAPVRILTGSQTTLSSPSGIAVDPIANEIFVANYDTHNFNGGASIAVFPRVWGPDGNIAPVRTIAGSSTGLNRPHGLVLDMTAWPFRLLVANSAYDQGSAVQGTIAAFHASDAGNVAPLLTLGGPSTLMCHPIQIAVDNMAPGGELIVAQAGGCGMAVTVYSLSAWLSTEGSDLAPIRTLVTEAHVPYDPIGVAVLPDEARLMPNITAEATLPGGAVVAFPLDPGITSCTPAAGSVFPLGLTHVGCTGSDIFGPTSTGFWVNVVDTTPPAFSGVANLEAEAFASTEVRWDVTATDRGAGVPVTCSPASGSLFYVGTTTVTCVADPIYGGPGASASFTVTVTKKVAPLPGGACFVVDFREITYFNGSAVLTSSDADIRTRNGIAGAFNPALWPYRAAGGAGYTKSKGTLFRIYGFTASSFGALVPNEDMPWITYPVQFDAEANGFYIDLGGPVRVRVCPNQFQDYVLAGKKGNGHKDSSALLPASQQNVPGIILGRNAQVVKLPTRIKREMDSLGLAHGDYGKIEYMAIQQQGNGNAQFREFVNLQLSFPGDSKVDRLQHYAFGLLTAFNINFESFAGCNYLDSAPGNDSVRLVDLWSPNKSTKQGYSVWQACGAREPVANQKVRENYEVAYNEIQLLSTVNSGTDTVNVLYGPIAPLTDADKKKKDLKIDWFDWDKADR